MEISDIAKALGRRGGQIRAKRLSAAKKSAIASLGGKTRAQSLLAAKRIRDNFRYMMVMQHLQGQVPKVRRTKSFHGRLPGLYP